MALLRLSPSQGGSQWSKLATAVVVFLLFGFFGVCCAQNRHTHGKFVPSGVNVPGYTSKGIALEKSPTENYQEDHTPGTDTVFGCDDTNDIRNGGGSGHDDLDDDDSHKHTRAADSVGPLEAILNLLAACTARVSSPNFIVTATPFINIADGTNIAFKYTLTIPSSLNLLGGLVVVLNHTNLAFSSVTVSAPPLAVVLVVQNPTLGDSKFEITSLGTLLAGTTVTVTLTAHVSQLVPFNTVFQLPCTIMFQSPVNLLTTCRATGNTIVSVSGYTMGSLVNRVPLSVAQGDNPLSPFGSLAIGEAGEFSYALIVPPGYADNIDWTLQIYSQAVIRGVVVTQASISGFLNYTGLNVTQPPGSTFDLTQGPYQVHVKFAHLENATPATQGLLNFTIYFIYDRPSVPCGVNALSLVTGNSTTTFFTNGFFSTIGANYGTFNVPLVHCNDRLPCSTGQCGVNNICQYTPATGTDCTPSGANFCDGVYSCNDTGDCSQTPRVCNDQLSCTVDSCNQTTQSCQFTPSNGLCDDLDPCTADSCSSSGQCLHTPYDCGSSSVTCHKKTCSPDPLNPTQPLCSDVPVNDGLACTNTSACFQSAGTCIAGNCDALPVNCTDGLFCTGVELCLSGVCISGTVPTCDDGNACTSDYCSGATDTCASFPDPSLGQSCIVPEGVGACAQGTYQCVIDPLNPLAGTTIQCVSNGPSIEVCGDNIDNDCINGIDNGCVGVPCLLPIDCASLQTSCNLVDCDLIRHECVVTPLDLVPCIDNNGCTISSFCSNGTCVGISGPLNPLNDPCFSVFNPCITNQCTSIDATHFNCTPVIHPGQQCDLGNLCYFNQQCSPEGDCSGTLKTCDDNNPCTADSCDSGTGNCTFTPLVGIPCSTGNPCFGGGICSLTSVCVEIPISPPTTTDPCKEYVCNPNATLPSQLFVLTPLDNGTPCSDPLNFCQINGTCQAGTCETVPVDCSHVSGLLTNIQSPECVHPQCIPGTGLCVATYSNSSVSCVPLNPCFTDGHCSDLIPGVCVGPAVDCSSVVTHPDCQVPVCDQNSGTCYVMELSGSCDDGDACTFADTCTPDGCTGTPVDCGTSDFCSGESNCVAGLCITDPNTIPDCSVFNDICQIGVCNSTSAQCEVYPPLYVGALCGITNEGTCSTGELICNSTGQPECFGNIDPLPTDVCPQLLRTNQTCACGPDMSRNDSRCVSYGIGTYYTVVTNLGITSSGTMTSAVNGNVALSPVTEDFITGSLLVITGTIHASDTTSMFVLSDVTDTFSYAMGQLCDTSLPPSVVDGVFTPGVYCFDFGMSVVSSIVFDAQGDPSASWIFKVTSGNLDVLGAQFVFINGASSCNVHFFASQIGVTSGSIVLGNLLSLGDISVGPLASVTGRVISLQGKLLISDSIISSQLCAETCQNATICSQIPELDIDEDGVVDCLDQCKSDPNQSVEGDCGCFSSEAAALNITDYCTRINTDRSFYGRGDGLDKDCDGVRVPNCGGIHCGTTLDCPIYPCKQALCTIEEVCTYVPIAGSCQVDIPCTLPLGQCVAGTCTSTPVTCDYIPGTNGPWDEQCVQGFCSRQEDMDSCVFVPTTGNNCTSENLCLSDTMCINGFCTGPTVQCSTGNPCVDGECNQNTGSCEYTNTTASCNPVDACYLTGVCQDAACIPQNAVVCDDGNDCTTDSCVTVSLAPLCLFTPVSDESFPCHNDLSPCYPSGVCVPGGATCYPIPLDCSFLLIGIPQKNQPCYEPLCDPFNSTCILEFRENVSCDDFDACTDFDSCSNGICSGVPSQDPFSDIRSLLHNYCGSSICNSTTGSWSQVHSNTPSCDDFDLCTTNECDGLLCEVTETTSCSDSRFCNGEEVCDRTTGLCLDGIAVNCTNIDNNLCTTPQCSETLGACVEILDSRVGLPCGNSSTGNCAFGVTECDPLTGVFSCFGAIYPLPQDLCDGGDQNCDTIINGGCNHTTCNSSADCEPLPCYTSVCNNHQCFYTFNDSLSCDDGLFCTENQCVSGTCVAEFLPSQDPQNPCVIHMCIEEEQQVITVNVTLGSGSCDSGDLCNIVSFCDGQGGCTGARRICEDANVCTEDGCDSETGNCTHTPLPGNPCVVNLNNVALPGSCTVNGTCQIIPDPCIYDDSCPVCDPLLPGNLSNHYNPCVIGSYDPIERHCVFQNLPNGTACPFYEDLCFNQSVCVSGVCTATGPRKSCDSITCFQNFCDSDSGDCVYTATPGAPCDDGNINTLNDTCHEFSNCCLGTVPGCSDDNPCTDDNFDGELQICIHTPNNITYYGTDLCDVCQCSAVEPGVPSCGPPECSDGLICNGEEFCDPLVGCRYAPFPDCDDGNFCTVDSCVEGTGCVHTPLDIIGTQCGPTDVGECEYGTYTCSPSGIQCSGAITPQPRDLCDGRDLDCDGFIRTDCNITVCETNEDCYPDYPTPCKVFTCTQEERCCETPSTGVCIPEQFDPCVTEYQCNYGLCLPFTFKSCPIPDGYAPECVNSYCSSDDDGDCVFEILDDDDYDIPCQVDDLNGICIDGRCIITDHPCDDFNPCTNDIFDPTRGGSCIHVPLPGTPCSLDDPCVVNPTCSDDAVCRGLSRNDIPVEEGGCYNSTAQCLDHICARSAFEPGYQCLEIHAYEGFVCDDKRNCTEHDHCHHGVCSGRFIDCDMSQIFAYGHDDDDDDGWNPNEDCIEATCVEELGGICVATPSEGQCNDGLFCTVGDTCSNTECTGNQRICAYDPLIHYQYSEECVDFTCNEHGRRCDLHFKAHANCTTLDPCDLYATCRYGRCEPVKIDCDDGDLCGGRSECEHGICKPGMRTECDDKNVCTIDYCNPFGGECEHILLDQIGKPCGFPAVVGICHPGVFQCNPHTGLYCEGSVFPSEELCGPDGTGDGLDNNCDGRDDEICVRNCTYDADCEAKFNGSIPYNVIAICAQNATCLFIECQCESASSLSELYEGTSSWSSYEEDDDDDDYYDYDQYEYNNITDPLTTTSSSSSSSSQKFSSLWDYLGDLFGFTSSVAEDTSPSTEAEIQVINAPNQGLLTAFIVQPPHNEQTTRRGRSSSSSSQSSDSEESENSFPSWSLVKSIFDLSTVSIFDIYSHRDDDDRHNHPRPPPQHHTTHHDDDDDDHPSRSRSRSRSASRTASPSTTPSPTSSISSSSSVSFSATQSASPTRSPSPSDNCHCPRQKNCGHGYFDQESRRCVCNPAWTGKYCDECQTNFGDDWTLLCRKVVHSHVIDSWDGSYRLVRVESKYADELLSHDFETHSGHHQTTDENDSHSETANEHHENNHNNREKSHYSKKSTGDLVSSSSETSHSEEEHHSHHHGHVYVLPGTNGLSCTCQSYGEDDPFGRDQFAMCEIPQILEEHHSSHHLGGSHWLTFEQRVLIGLFGVIILAMIVVAVVLCVPGSCGKSRSRKNRSKSWWSKPREFM